MTEVGALRSVNVTAIRQELHELWKSESLNDKTTTIKAQTHNLVVYVDDESQLDRLTERIIQLTSVRPGRVIVLFRAEVDDELNAWVTAYCRQVASKQVCGELIMLQVGDALKSGVHSDVIGLLAPDLPVFLYWMAVPDEHDALFKYLAAEADRILVDTHYMGDEARIFPLLAELSKRYAISDLNWSRLGLWRRLLAQIWGAHEVKERLDELQSLDIHFNTSEDLKNSARALLVAGWLASCLDWSLVRAVTGRKGGYTTAWHRFDEFGWDGKVELVESKHADLSPGELVGIFIQAGNEPPYIMPRIQLEADKGLVELRIDDASLSAARRQMVFRPVTTADALAEELDLSYDPMYTKALMIAADIVKMAHGD